MRLGVDHHVVVAYAPQSNKVERVNKEIKAIMASLLLQNRMIDDDWPLLVPVIEMVLNHTPHGALGGQCPVTVFTGLPACTPIHLTYRDGDKVLRKLSATPEQVVEHVNRMRGVIDERNEHTDAVRPRPHPRRSGEQAVDFTEGDYCLLSTVTRPRDKTRPVWQGPVKIVADGGRYNFTVEDLVTGKRQQAHAQHLKRYADADLHVTPQLRDYAAFNGAGNVIENILSHRRIGDRVELLIHWEYETPEEATWEPMDVVVQTAAATVKRYVKSIQDASEKARLQALVDQL